MIEARTTSPTVVNRRAAASQLVSVRRLAGGWLIAALVAAGLPPATADEPNPTAAPASPPIAAQTRTDQSLPDGGSAALYRLHARQQGLEQEILRITEISRALDLENQNLAVELAAALDELAQLRRRLADAQAGRQAADQALRERETAAAGLQGELSRLEQLLARNEEARERLLQEKVQNVAELEARIKAQAAALQVDVEALRGDKQTLDSALETTRAEAAEREAALQEQVSALTGQLEAARADQQASEAELDKVRGEAAELARQLDELRESAAETERVAQAAQAAWTVEREELTGILNQSQDEVEDLQQRLKVLDETHAGALAAVERLTSDKTDLQQRQQTAEQTAAELSEQRVQAEQALAALRAELEAATGAAAAELARVQGTAEAELAAMVERLRDKDAAAAELAAAHEAVAAELAAAAEQIGEKEARAAELAQANEQAEAALAAAAQQLAEKDALADRLANEKAELAAGLAAATEQIRAKESLAADLAQANEQARAELADLERRAEAARAELAETRDALAAAETEVSGLRARLPVTAGGSITDEELRDAAAGHLGALRTLYEERGAMPEAEWTSQRDQLVEALREQQFTLARSLGARSLHRVQANDTLAGISRAIYGRAGDWPKIFEANRHLVENPDRLFPGMTLVIP